MAFNKENYKRIREDYNNKYIKARETAEAKKNELHTLFPELAEIDRAIARTGPAVFAAAMKGKNGLEERLAAIRAENEALRDARAKFLVAKGYPADYTDVKYECTKCNDSGFVDGVMCSCMREKLVLAGLESSGFGKLIETQSFDSFSLKYYERDRDTYAKMKYVYDALREYAEGFDARSGESVIMFGATGLGKTHLSSALARRIIERGFDVQYVSAIKLISDFEHDRFRRDTEGEDISRYYDCDLLIIDDLGCEMSNQFTVSCLYDVINNRINTNKSTIVSTNLTPAELRDKYWDRITSRLLGEYRVLLFVGNDVRGQKLSEK